MSAQFQHVSPVIYIYSNQPNWRPADLVEEYIRNCDEGLEERSKRRLAKLFGMSPIELWRWEQISELPDDLFEALIAGRHARRQSSKSLAAVALALRRRSTVLPQCLRREFEDSPGLVRQAGARAMSERTQRYRAELRAKFPAEFEHGYRTGYLGENQPPCDAAGYMIGHHTWPLVRKNAWFAGFNLGYVEREAGDG